MAVKGSKGHHASTLWLEHGLHSYWSLSSLYIRCYDQVHVDEQRCKLTSIINFIFIKTCCTEKCSWWTMKNYSQKEKNYTIVTKSQLKKSRLSNLMYKRELRGDEVEDISK